jgi:hypothetical protein
MNSDMLNLVRNIGDNRFSKSHRIHKTINAAFGTKPEPPARRPIKPSTLRFKKESLIEQSPQKPETFITEADIEEKERV